MGICDWPVGERPRERLLAHGAFVLSDSELLALLLRTGDAGRSALDLARDLLGHFGGLSALFGASLAEVAATRGLGPAKAAELAAVVALLRRSHAEEATPHH